MPRGILLRALMRWIGIVSEPVLIPPLVLKCWVWFTVRLIHLILIFRGFLIKSLKILPMVLVLIRLKLSLLFLPFVLLIVVCMIICTMGIESRLFRLRLRNLIGCIIGIGEKGGEIMRLGRFRRRRARRIRRLRRGLRGGYRL